jgi:hypothetical protein
VQTAEGELAIDIRQVREAAETFASKLFPRTPKLLRTEPLKALVIGAFVRGLSMRDVESLCEQVKTLIHELIHRTDSNAPELSYAEEEIVVESIAFSVAGGLGIDTSGYSIPYLTCCSQDDADIEIVEACAELIDHHAKRIENAIGDPPNPTATSETA